MTDEFRPMEDTASWNMAELTTREIRRWMSLYNLAFVEAKWIECYKYCLIEYNEIFPLISEQFTSKVKKYDLKNKKEVMIKAYIKHKHRLTNIPSQRFDCTEFVTAIEDLNLSLRQAMADTGLMMTRPSDVLGTFAKKHR